jgi:hypothetical protein
MSDVTLSYEYNKLRSSIVRNTATRKAKITIKAISNSIEHCGQVANTLALYLGSPMFKSQCGHWVSWLRIFVVFLSPSRRMLG